MISVRNKLTGNISNRTSLKAKVNVSKIPIYPELEDISITPTNEQQVFTHENSYGYDKVTVEAMPEIKLQDKELTINENGTHNIVADEEYDGLNQVSVTVDAIEDLTEELTTYNTELTEQETKIDEVVEILQNKGAIPKKYTPTYISFASYTGYNLDYEVANLDVSNMTALTNLFTSCTRITSLDLSGFNTSNATSMMGMFSQCNKLVTLNLSNFDTSNVTNMSNMFNYCHKLTSLDLSSFDTSNVTNMNYMFCQCNALTSLDLSNFDTSNVTSMYCMFHYCNALQYLDIRNFDFTKVTSYTNMFSQVPTACEIIVKDDTAKEWITSKFTTLTNVKTVAELEG